MIDTIFGMAVGLCFFLCSINAYTLGIEHGRDMSKGLVPKLELNPIKPIVNAIEKHEDQKEADVLTDDFSDIMSFNMEAALNAVKKGG